MTTPVKAPAPAPAPPPTGGGGGPLRAAYQRAFGLGLRLIEAGLVPDAVIRRGIRGLLQARLTMERAGGFAAAAERKNAFVEELRALPVAVHTQAANEQHYEVPTEYFLECLGPRLKYSCCLYKPGEDWRTGDLGEAEEAMLELYCARAELRDGLDVLELGCGWGSLSLFLAAKYPNSSVTGVSNSRTQREHILGQAKRRGLTNLEIITADAVVFEAPAQYDRVLSVEMFEHMKNYEILFGRIARWLRPGGKLFVHVFSHKSYCYHYEDNGEDDWMTRYFFTGGTMPSHDLFAHFQDDLKLRRHWWLNGMHYANTLRKWLALMDGKKAKLRPLFEQTYGAEDTKWWNYWRVFYLACEEMFAYGDGEEWGVSHYLFENPAERKAGREGWLAGAGGGAASPGRILN